MRAFSSIFVADVIALTCQDFVVLKGAGRVGGKRSKERDRKSELVLGSTYQIFEWDKNNSDRNFDFWETNPIAADRIF